MDGRSCLLSCNGWEELLRRLRERGYTIRDDPHRKYATLQKEGFRPVRFATLGYHYSKERVIERMADPRKHMVAGLDMSSFIAQKRVEYALMSNILALQYLLAIERIFRLIISNSNRRKSKLDLSRPYSLLNDFYLARALYRLAAIDKHRVRNKEQLRQLMEKEGHREPQPAILPAKKRGGNIQQAGMPIHKLVPTHDQASKATKGLKSKL